MLTNFYTYILFYIIIICSTFGYGLAICSLPGKFKVSNNPGYTGLIGVFFLIIYSYISNIFIKHGIIHNSIILIIGFILFIYCNIYTKTKNYKEWFYFVVIFLILLIGAFIFKTHDDFPYYHFPYSYYLTQSSSIIGIGQFNLGFRTPSSIFYLDSLLYLPLIKYYMFQMPPILIMGFSNLILLIRIKNNIINNKINFITYFSLLTFIFINIFFYRMAEHGTDKSAQILVFVLFIEILLLTNFNTEISKQISKIYILIGLIISFKAFFILYGIFFLIIFFYLINKYNLKEVIKKIIYNIYFFGFFAIFLLIIFNNFINSGCLIYPVGITCFENTIWSVGLSEVATLNDWYEQWAKAGAGPNYRVENPAHYIKNFNWVSNWFDLYFFNKVSDYLLGLLFLSMVFLITFKSKVKIKTKNRKFILLIILILILLFEWFYNHPALRYGGYCLITSIIFIYIALFLEKFSNEPKGFKKKFLFFVCLTLIIFVSRNIYRISYENKTYNYDPINEVFYDIDDVYFETQEKFDELINNYNECNLNKNNCNINDEFEVKKIMGNYIFYRKK